MNWTRNQGNSGLSSLAFPCSIPWYAGGGLGWGFSAGCQKERPHPRLAFLNTIFNKSHIAFLVSTTLLQLFSITSGGFGQTRGAPSTPRPDAADVKAYLDALQQIKNTERANDFAALTTLAQKLQAIWIEKNANQYGHIMEMISGGFSNAPDQETQALKRKYALTALRRMDDMTLPEQAALADLLVSDLELGRPISNDDFAKQRLENAKIWLTVYKHVQDAIDPKWDPKDIPTPVSPPSGPNGVSPDTIQDPIAREKYRAALAEREKKQVDYNVQVDARKAKLSIERTIEHRLVAEYSRQPNGLNELTIYMNQYVADDAMKGQILSKVKANLADAGSQDPSTQPTAK